jgi:hypothetical protein
MFTDFHTPHLLSTVVYKPAIAPDGGSSFNFALTFQGNEHMLG